MCKEMDEIRNEGKLEGKKETAENLLKIGMSIEKIADVLEVDKKTVEKWLEESMLVEA